MGSSIIQTVLYFFFLITACFAIDRCPPAVVLTPCKCTNGNYPVTIACSNITEIGILHEVFEKSTDWPFEGFVLEKSNIMYIPASAVMSKRMQQITIKDSFMTSLFDVSPHRNNTVSHINIFNVKFQRGIRWELMNTLSTLLDIKIESSEFRKLGKDFAENVGESLRKFLMKDTKTTSLDDNAFEKMTRLDTIRFQESKISTLKRSMFANPSRLFVFDFRYNSIETLPDDMFDGMERIEDIFLQGNLIKYFSESVFGGHLYDEVVFDINLQGNPIMCDCSIKWFIYKQRWVEVNAACAMPEDKKGKHVRELKVEDFHYCPKFTNTVWDAIE